MAFWNPLCRPGVLVVRLLASPYWCLSSSFGVVSGTILVGNIEIFGDCLRVPVFKLNPTNTHHFTISPLHVIYSLSFISYHASPYSG